MALALRAGVRAGPRAGGVWGCARARAAGWTVGAARRAASTATTNFYRVRVGAPVSDEELRRDASAAEALCRGAGIVGTVILAPEGVNGSLAGPLHSVRRVVDELTSAPPEHWAGDDAEGGLVSNEEVCAGGGPAPFRKLKVKVKEEIVSMRLDQPLDLSRRGVAVPPAVRSTISLKLLVCPCSGHKERAPLAECCCRRSGTR